MVSSLYSLAIHKVGQYVGCASLETVNPPFDEQTLKLLASEAFPKDEEHVKLLTELVSSKNCNSEWEKGESFFQKGHVQNIRQVGFMIGASVKSNYDHNQAIAKVVLTFERHRITSTKCSICKEMIWCRHIVAVILKRIKSPEKVPVHAPLTDTLLTLTREQLQKLLQYAINQSPGDILCQIFEHIDKIKNPRSLISRIQGYPDPTLGIGEDEQNTDQLLLKEIRRNLDNDLLYTDNYESKLQSNSLSDQVQFMASENHSLKEKNLKTAISLLRIKDVDMAGRILIQIAQALFEGPRLSPSSMSFRLDVERWFSLFVSSFEGQIRHDILTVALDINKRSSNADGSVIQKFIFKDQQTTMRSVSLKTAGNFNPRDYLGENKKAPFYEPVLACLLQNTPANLENLYSQKVPLSQSPYEEPLDVMLFRFEKLIQIDQFMKDPSVKTKTCLLGAVILRKLIKISTQFSNVGSSKNEIEEKESNTDCIDVDISDMLPDVEDIPDEIIEVYKQSEVPEFPDMDKWVQMNLKEYLMNLLHAYNCQQKKINCNDQICKQLKSLLTHMQSCTDGRLCKNKECFRSRLMLQHWNSCNRVECLVCSPLKTKVVMASVMNFGHAKCDMCKLIRKNYCHYTCTLPCLMCAAGKTITVKEKDGSFCLHFIRQLSGEDCSGHTCRYCHHMKNTESGTNSKSTTCLTICDKPNSCRLCSNESSLNKITLDTEIVTEFMVKKDQTYGSAYRVLGLQGFGKGIQSDYKAKETSKSQSPCRAGGRNKKLKVDNATGWKDEVTFGFRNHFIGKIVQALLPVSSQTRMIVMNVTAYCTRIEHEIFQQSSSQEEYLHLLLDRLYKIKADIEQPLLDAVCKTDSEGNSKESLQQTDVDGPKAKKRRTLPDTSDEEIEEVNYEGLTENQLKYCQLYVSTRVLQTEYILNMNIMIQVIVFSGAFQAFELSNMFDSRTIGESSDNLKKELASKFLPKYQNQTIFQALSCLYSYGLQLCYGIPLTFTTFLVTYGGLSKEDKALLAIQALTECDRPLTDTETEEFSGNATEHYGKLMKVLFPPEYNRFHTELAEQFLVHLETVKDKAFVTAAVEHFMDHFNRFPAAHHRTILLDLVIKFMKEKWISRSDKYYHSYAAKMYQMLKRLLDSSSGFAETITVLLLKNWSCVCKYFMPKVIKDILKDIEKVVESDVFKDSDQLLKLVETYLLEECVHDMECGTLIKIFYKDEKIFASRVLGKIRDNKDKYTQALLMKLSKYAKAISTSPPFSEPSSASNSLQLMALEACSKKCRACKVVGSSIESRLQLYEPTEKELKYFVFFFEVIGSSVNNNLMSTIEFLQVLDKLKIIFISSYGVMMEFINLVKKYEVQEKVIKLLEDTIVECCRERFIEEVRKSNYSKHGILVDNLIEACRLCVDNVTNGKLRFQERVVNHLLEKFKTKEKTCEKIKAQFS
ncbi:uncharacterized protein LOC127734425 [Mytilus californianus]|uniref:uncharacterized protein LOC127734425 n=1 Tax=Mytilus californianus TaxID=6549 RepID=UPI002246430D|nr:uncharacterized protein LOC127734425 [Mytilus californianus]XP_052100231.1 uncharacterized protein LOC127734425 [Mytilus californianus]